VQFDVLRESPVPIEGATAADRSGSSKPYSRAPPSCVKAKHVSALHGTLIGLVPVQDASGKLTQCSGPVEEMLGIGDSATEAELAAAGWNMLERATLKSKIANRQPFLDFIYSRALPDGRVQYLQVSGEPMFDAASAFCGYRGIGLDVSERMQRPCVAAHTG
jgi:PAS domain-containing protein